MDLRHFFIVCVGSLDSSKPKMVGVRYKLATKFIEPLL